MLLVTYLIRQVGEIASTPALRWYGAAIALTNALTALYWLLGDISPAVVLSPSQVPICWPFWENCYNARWLSPVGIDAVVLLLFGSALLNAAIFLRVRWTGFGYWALIVLAALRFAVVAQDFRLTLNHHYMSLWVTLVFAFIPNKIRNSYLLLVLFYVWAGILKLYPGSDWLSGAAFYGRRPFGIPEALVPLACGYVILLETIGSFLLLAKSNKLFLFGFGQFVLFHIASWWVVGYFYPCLMFLLLSIMPVVRVGRWHQSFSAGLRSSTSIGLVATFSAAQLLPAFYPGNSALTGEGRIFALNMFDAPVVCRGFIIPRSGAEAGREIPLRAPLLNTRVWCDPIVYFNLAHSRCRERSTNGPDFDLVLLARRIRDPKPRRVVNVESFCTARLTYSVWSHNSWIRSDVH